MFKLLFISILLYQIVKCYKYSIQLDDFLKIPGADINDFNSIQIRLSDMDKIDYITKFNTDFDAEGISQSQDSIFEITEDIIGLAKKRYLKKQLEYLKNTYKHLNLTETNEETIKPDDSFNTVLTKLQNDVDVKLNYVHPIFKKVYDASYSIQYRDEPDNINFKIPYEFTPHIRKLFIHNFFLSEKGYMLSFVKKLLLFEINDCELQEHVLPNIIEFFKTKDKKEWMRITSSLKVYTDQCLKNPEDIQTIKSKIPSSSIKNLIFGDTVCLRNVETNDYLKSINIHNMSASVEKKINYTSEQNTFTIQNSNGKYMQVLMNRDGNIVGSHNDFDSERAFWKVIPDGDYVNFENAEVEKYLYINEYQNAEMISNYRYEHDANPPIKYQWEVEVNCPEVKEVKEE